MEKIFYVHKGDQFKGYVVATSEADAIAKAVAKLNVDPATITVKDTGKTRPKCCPRR